MRAERRGEGRITLGVVANEFFDLATGRVGGFGWAAAQVARCFAGNPELGVDVVFLTGELRATPGRSEVTVHGVPLLMRDAKAADYALRLRAARIDLLLSIDYRPSYDVALNALRRTPVILWVRDPRPPEDTGKVATLEIPGAPGVRPQGIQPVDCTAFARVRRRARWWRRPVLFATTIPSFGWKVPGTYGVRPRDLALLPNPLELPPPGAKSPTPLVVFVGRLDPIKRPWLFVELARRFPDVRFVLLGQAHFHGEGSWETVDLPSNVESLGHLDGAAKWETLTAAWALVNTSIHESLAVSFLEALAVETPIVSCQDPEGLASRFGTYVGRWDGTGLEGLPAFASGLGRLLSDAALRERCGRAGRAWVAASHTREAFLRAFADLAARAGLPVPAALAAPGAPVG